MALIVQKYGGTSVADADRVKNVAARVAETKREGNQVIVVVSAPAGMTDDLTKRAFAVTSSPRAREMDMLLSTGEQISISLLAMAIEKIGRPVISLTGWQAGMKTDARYSNARIDRIDTERLKNELDKKKIVIVAGFQGINKYDDITTLGRGGSDTSAVALAAALQKNSQPVQKITIVPRTMGALGYTMQMPEEEKYLMSKDEMLDQIVWELENKDKDK